MESGMRVATTAERLREAMKDAEMKQTDLVRETGLNKSAISRYLSGEYEPKQDAIYKLAAALNVTEMWLWGYDVQKDRTEMHKINDLIADVVIRMQSDDDFRGAVQALYELDIGKVAGVRQMLEAFK
ncbi:MAG: helix-turn-helix domain-containing protein [Eubacteriales bacterium]